MGTELYNYQLYNLIFCSYEAGWAVWLLCRFVDCHWTSALNSEHNFFYLFWCLVVICDHHCPIQTVIVESFLPVYQSDILLLLNCLNSSHHELHHSPPHIEKIKCFSSFLHSSAGAGGVKVPEWWSLIKATYFVTNLSKKTLINY